MSAAAPRWTTSPLYPVALAVGSVGLAYVAVHSPMFALVGVAALLFAATAAASLTLGLACFIVLQFIVLVPIFGTAGDLTVVKGAGAILAGVWLLQCRRQSWELVRGLREHQGLLIAVVLFIAWGAVSLRWAPNFDEAWLAVQRYGLNAILLIIVITAAASRDRLEWVLRAIAGGAAIASVIAIASGADLAEENRISGSIGDANVLASLLVAGFVIACALAVASSDRSWRLLMGAAALACLWGIFPTLSRGGLLALAIAILVWAAFGGRWRPRLAAIALAVALATTAYFGVYASEKARARVTTVGASAVADTSGGGSGRDDIWRVGWRAFLDRPLIGHGIGNYQEVTPDYVDEPGLVRRGELVVAAEPRVAHNTFLQILVEGGIVGMATFIAIVATSVGAAVRAAKRFAAHDDHRLELLARSLVAGIAGLMVANLFISGLYSRVFWILLGLGPVLLVIARRDHARAAVAGAR